MLPKNFTDPWCNSLTLGLVQRMLNFNVKSKRLSDQANVQFWVSCCFWRGWHCKWAQQSESLLYCLKHRHSCVGGYVSPTLRRGRSSVARHLLHVSSQCCGERCLFEGSQTTVLALCSLVTCGPETWTMPKAKLHELTQRVSHNPECYQGDHRAFEQKINKCLHSVWQGLSVTSNSQQWNGCTCLPTVETDT